jgi:hypothetical protein
VILSLVQQIGNYARRVKWNDDSWLFIGVQSMLQDYMQRTFIPPGDATLLPDPLTPAAETLTFTLSNHNASNIPDPLVIQSGILPTAQDFVYITPDATPPLPPISVYVPTTAGDPGMVSELFMFFGDARGVQFKKRAVYLTRAYFGGDDGGISLGDIHSLDASVLISLKNLKFKTPLDADAQNNLFRFEVTAATSTIAPPVNRAQFALFVLTGKKLVSATVTTASFEAGANTVPPFDAIDGGWDVSPHGAEHSMTKTGKVHRKSLALTGMTFGNGAMVEGIGPW